MVRTLDFHSKNVGSSPASLKMNFKKIKTRYEKQDSKKIKYSIKLTSIFTPDVASNSSLNINIYSKGSFTKQNKIMVKQSYMILTWLSYLAKIGSDQKQKSKNTLELNNTKKISTPLFFVCPKKQTKITTIKSPMAHKTFSQEQFQFRYYSFNISFNIKNSDSVTKINSVNQSIYVALLIRKNFLNFSTNMLFIKRFRASLPLSDKLFLTI